MSNSISFEVRKKLEAGDFGEDMGDGFFMQDVGGTPATPGPALTADPLQKNKPMTRAERQKLADGFAARLMDNYMSPEVLNDSSVLNPIRDGIPQCSAHPFVAGDATKIGCIHGCGGRERQGSAGVLPVARDGTVADVWQWVQALVRMAITTQDKRLGYTAGGVDLGGN